MDADQKGKEKKEGLRANQDRPSHPRRAVPTGTQKKNVTEKECVRWGGSAGADRHVQPKMQQPAGAPGKRNGIKEKGGTLEPKKMRRRESARQ